MSGETMNGETMSGGAREGEEGTTLLELLVALALLALLAVYAVSAIRYLRNFDRVQAAIEERATVEAARLHMRRSVEAMRAAFLLGKGSVPKLAFSGEKGTVAFVTHADSRLEYGGLYLVRYWLAEDASGRRQLMTSRRAFRPQMDPVAADNDGFLVLDGVTSLSFAYFGSPQEGVRPQWYDDWPAANVLPQAIRIEITLMAGEKSQFAPITIMIPVAR